MITLLFGSVMVTSGQNRSLAGGTGATAGQKAVRSAVKPLFAIGESVSVRTVRGDADGKDHTTPRLPVSNPSPGPPGIGSAKNRVTKTVSSASSLSPSLVMAMAAGFGPTVTVSTTFRAEVSMTDTVPAV